MNNTVEAAPAQTAKNNGRRGRPKQYSDEESRERIRKSQQESRKRQRELQATFTDAQKLLMKKLEKNKVDDDTLTEIFKLLTF